MRSFNLPFKIFILPIIFILLFSSQNIFAQSGWQSMYSGSINYNFEGVHFKDSQNGLAADLHGTIFKTTNGGTNWTKVFENSIYDVSGIQYLCDTNVLVIREHGHFLRTTNYGLNWSETLTSLDETTKRLIFLNELTGYELNGSIRYIQKTTNGGLNWDTLRVPLSGMPYPPANTFPDMNFINSNTGWITVQGNIVIGGHGTFWSNMIKKTTDGGLNWNLVFTSSSPSLYGRIKYFNEYIAWTWARGGNSIYKSSNGGTSWDLFGEFPNYAFYQFFMIDDNTGWATGKFGANYTLVKTTNGGVNWILQFSDPSVYINSVDIKNSDTAWFSGSNRAVYKTTNGGGIISTINPISSNIPEKYLLTQNFPNPFNPTTKINFGLKNTAFAMLRIYDITGREVRTLVNEKLSAGSYSYDFNANELPSGVYFYQLQTDGFIETKKMILLK